MITYLIRRILYAVPILIGVNIITFVLFFVVNSPDDMARIQLGVKRVTMGAVTAWEHEHGYDLPLLYNQSELGFEQFTHTIFFEKSLSLFSFQFGTSDSGRNIGYDISQRMWPSLAIAIPSLIIGLMVDINLTFLIVLFRSTYLDLWGMVICIIMMSISSMFSIIGGQYLISKLWHLVPISGYNTGLDAFKFLVLPIIIGVIGGIGSRVRWYRTLFLEEIHRDYVRTARLRASANTQ